LTVKPRAVLRLINFSPNRLILASPFKSTGISIDFQLIILIKQMALGCKGTTKFLGLTISYPAGYAYDIK
jgi:hypothetical protein